MSISFPRLAPTTIRVTLAKISLYLVHRKHVPVCVRSYYTILFSPYANTALIDLWLYRASTCLINLAIDVNECFFCSILPLIWSHISRCRRICIGIPSQSTPQSNLWREFKNSEMTFLESFVVNNFSPIPRSPHEFSELATRFSNDCISTLTSCLHPFKI